MQFEKLNSCQARYQAVLDGLTIKSQYQDEYFSKNPGSSTETFVTKGATVYLQTIFIPEIGIPGLGEKILPKELNLGNQSGKTFELLEFYKRPVTVNSACGTFR